MGDLMKFSKIHGLGNDFIVLDETECELFKNDSERTEFTKKYCDRKFGVGADGVLFMRKSSNNDFRMQIINSDGSEAENCVNGLRCVSMQRFLSTKEKEFSIETLAGAVNSKILNGDEKKVLVELKVLGKQDFIEKDEIKIDDFQNKFCRIDMGNPHAVFFIKEKVSDFDLKKVGPKIEFHEKFQPNKTNAEFVNVITDTQVNYRVHERGVGETLSCGSGSLAIVVAGVKEGLLKKDEWIKVEQPAGILEINYGNSLILRGPAEKIFEGNLNVV